MKRLGTLCMTALAIATCSLALVGCGKTNSKTGTCEPNPGSTKAIEKTEPPVSFDKMDEDIIDPQGWTPTPKNSSPSTLRQTRTSMLPAWTRTPTATATPRSSLR